MDQMLKASLDWINEIAYPQTEFIHNNDENKVKCASRALDKMGVTIDVDEVATYCRSLGMPQGAIDKIVDWYSRPKGLRLKCGLQFKYSDLKKIWKERLNNE